MMKFLIFLGLRLWKNHGYWIDKEHNIAQTDYNKMPLLGKIGVNLMIFGLKHDKKLNKNFKPIIPLINHLKYGELADKELIAAALFLYFFSIANREELLMEIQIKQQ